MKETKKQKDAEKAKTLIPVLYESLEQRFLRCVAWELHCAGKGILDAQYPNSQVFY